MREQVLGLRSRLYEAKEMPIEHRTTIPIELLHLLKSWLLEHLRDTDQKYVATFKENGL